MLFEFRDHFSTMRAFLTLRLESIITSGLRLLRRLRGAENGGGLLALCLAAHQFWLCGNGTNPGFSETGPTSGTIFSGGSGGGFSFSTVRVNA